MIGPVMVLPTPRALLPPFSEDDPVADPRVACTSAIASLPPDDMVVVVAVPTDDANLARGVAEPLGHRIARHLLGPRRFVPNLALPWAAASLLEQDAAAGKHPRRDTTLLVMADGSARRTEKA